jgi:hypothetical protein
MTTVLRGEPALEKGKSLANVMHKSMTGDMHHLRKALAAAKESVDQEEHEEDITLDSSRVGDTARDYNRGTLYDRSNSPGHKPHQDPNSAQTAPGENRLGLVVYDKFYVKCSRLIVAYISMGSFVSFEGDAIVNASQWPKLALDNDHRGWGAQGTDELCMKYKAAVRDIDSRCPRTVGLLLLDSSMLQGAWSMENVARLGCEAINEALVASSHIQEVHFLAKTNAEAEAIAAAVAGIFRRAPVAFSPSPRSKKKIENWAKNPLAPRSFRDFPDLDPPQCPKIFKNERHPWRPTKAPPLSQWLGLSAGGALAEMNLRMGRMHIKRTYHQAVDSKVRNLRPTLKAEHVKPFR